MKSVIVFLFILMLSSIKTISQNFWYETSYNYGGAVYALISDTTYVNNLDIVVGTGSSHDDTPFFTMYTDVRSDLLYTATEIFASGGSAGTIYKIGFNVQGTPSSMTMYGFTIKMQPTKLTDLTGILESGWTTVYQVSSYLVPGSGWQYFFLQNPYNWNGVDNLLIEICFHNTTFGGSTNVFTTTFTDSMRYRRYVDYGNGCSLTNSQGYGIGSLDRANLAISFHPYTTNFHRFSPLSYSSSFFAGSENGRIYKTTDLGLSWVMNNYNFNSVKCFSVSRINGYMFAGTYSNGIHRSINNGTSWSLSGLSGSTIYSLAVNNTNGYIFAAQPNGSPPGGIYRTTNNGSNWSVIGLQYNYPYCLAVNQTGTVYAGYEAGVSSSNDDGNNWNYINLGSEHVYSLASSDFNHNLFAGTARGIFRTSDNGNNWVQVYNNSSYSVNILIADRFGNVYAGTDGNGVIYSTDNGNNWTQINSGLSNLNIYSMCIDSSGYLFAGATNRVFRSNNPILPPSKPILISPFVNSTNLSLTPTLIWNQAIVANTYRVQLSTDSIFNNIIFDTSGVTLTNIVIRSGILNSNTKYFWRVNATNNAGTSNWSVVWNFITQNSIQTSNIFYNANWNLIGIPLLLSNMNLRSIFPTCTSPAYSFNNGYIPDTILGNAKGYWILFNSGGNQLINGTAIYPTNIPVVQNWNLISGFNSIVDVATITTNPPGIINSNFFWFDGNSYVISTTMEPGKSYWVSVNQNGTLILPASSDKIKGNGSYTNNNIIKNDWLNFNITDNSNKGFHLYLARKEEMADNYILPPIPPLGILDVRFSLNSFVEALGSGKHLININSAKYPLKISVKNLSGIKIRIVDNVNGKILDKYIQENDEIVINDPLNSLIVYDVILPSVFSLSQNYPNPFNPITVIKYQIPKKINVKLIVYDCIGREITTLVNSIEEPGFYDIKFDATNYASGVYFYKLTAGNYTNIKKMVILK